jgi:hypothetical protein
MNTNLELRITKRTDERLLERMKNHYSHPRGFVGRNICYAILYDDIYYGHIIAGSATRFLPGRNEFLGISLSQLNNVINNVFYSVSKVNEQYPTRNFTQLVLNEFVKKSSFDWENKYGDKVVGFESLIEPPRTGELYRRCGWIKMENMTKGYTCKRVSEKVVGMSTDSWGGRRVWDYENLRPKLVYCFKENQND